MVGFYGGSPLEYEAINQQGSDAVPSSTGPVLGAAFGSGPGATIPRLMRSTGRLAAETGLLAVDEYGRQIMGEPDEQLDPESANQQFGIKGALSFDKPVAKSVAQDLYDHKREQIERDDTITRRAGGIFQGGVARFTASMAAGLLDPINLAVGLIPIVGEARVASLLGRGAIEAAGAAERAGVRAVAGGVSGAAQMAALQPLEFALSKQEHEDYTMADALRSIALGTVLGGGLHAGTGALIDRTTGLYRNPVTQRLEDAGPEARETLLQGALAQTIEGRPVDVAPALDAISISGPHERAPTELPIVRFRRDAAAIEAALPPPAEGLTRLWRGMRPGEAGNATAFTNDLAGIALPFREPYGGNVGYVDVPTPDLAKYLVTSGGAPGAEFSLPPEVARGAREVLVSPRDPQQAVNNAIAAARREPATDSAAQVEADRSPAQPSDTLQEIQKQAEDLERMRAPDAATEGRTVQDAPAAAEAASAGDQARPAPPSEAQVAADLVESRASAIERAAACITRG